MHRKPRFVLVLACAAALLAACADDTQTALPLDDEGASFGIGKADGPSGGYAACELREILEAVNESVTTADLLVETVGIHRQAADSLMAYRLGPDGVNGTGDDNLFDDLAELDAVAYVGPKALEALSRYAGPRCGIDLSARPFIHRGTWVGTTGGGWGRNAPEFEATMVLTGVEPRKLRELLKTKDSRDRTVFSRLRRHKIMEAFTYGFNLDEMPWDSDSVEAREKLPYVTLSIESERFAPDAPGEQRELSLGTDFFDDIYYDTVNYDLHNNEMILRGRARWDTLTEVRRLLVQAKSATVVDENGIKSAAKIDVRTDSGSSYLATLDDDVRSGTVAWSGSRVPVEAIKTVYDALDAVHLLPDLQGYQGVLALDPKAFLRSDRSRFHFNLTDRTKMTAFYNNGRDRIQHAVTYAQAALDSGVVQDADRADVQALVAMGQGILDGSLVRDRAAARLAALDPPVTEAPAMPEQFATFSVTSQSQLDALQIVAESADALFDEFDDALDAADRDLTGTSGLDFDAYVDLYVAFQVSLDQSLGIKTTYKPFADRYAQFVAQGDSAIDTQITTFNAFGEAQKAAGNADFADFVPMTRDAWNALGKHLDFEVLKISQRMIRNGGTMANALWFELARSFYVPRAPSSAWSNFIIDTFDVTDFLTPEEWARIPEDQRNPTHELPAASVYHTKLVNEVQIELTSVEPYIQRIEELEAQLAAASTPELERQLAGAKFVLNESIRTLQVVAELKGPAIVDRLEDEGLRDVKWEPAKFSKGQTALRILTDTDDHGQ